MRKEEFVNSLKNLAPPIEYFLELGYSLPLADKEVKGYECKYKKGQLSGSTNNELLDLVSFYDCSNVQIGIVSFFENPKPIKGYYLIGNAEADILAIDKVTSEVQVLDHEDLNWVIWACAINGEQFLYAMLNAANFISERSKNPGLITHTRFTYENVLECASRAGGEKYMNFYAVLLGYDD